MPKQRDGLPYYTLARNLNTGRREIYASTDMNATEFGTALRDRGYAVSIIFSESDYKRAANKSALSGPATLSTKEIHIHDTYPDILSGRWPITYIRKESPSCQKQLSPST